ncbi:PD-(D/E)XK nuclease family protein [Helicobacter muridarum]|uniref:Exonuclease n=1 Tax=Helicobacter muridarum TaxID=216 RepID=A0A099TYX0_9HELI|nr:PD-(D/E)XK nuclease family protein [Helicobacter muridarum]TLE00625.1 PD-(D/E)XK nuclease family protein [Helicobacter muridarum]STQ85643.1 exonuclease [Helicobacter muridarum]
MSHNNNLNLFMQKRSLYILSNARAKGEFYLRCLYADDIDFSPLYLSNKENTVIKSDWFCLFNFSNPQCAIDTILPNAMTLDEFFQKIIYTSNALVPGNLREFFLSVALKTIKHNKDLSKLQSAGIINPEESFISYLESSNILLKFYDELRAHKIPITIDNIMKFSEIDTYIEYEWQLALLAEIYTEYQRILSLNNLTDSIYSNDISHNYHILEAYLQKFESVHIDLDGFISPIQYEIISHIAKIIPICIHFSTDSYNISHYTHAFSKSLESNCKYIYCVSNDILVCKKESKLNTNKINLYKTQRQINQANLALHLALDWQNQILDDKANESDFAIILPDESFATSLMVLDSCNLFNYAMGINIQTLEEYMVLKSLQDNMTKDIAQKNKYDFQTRIDITPIISFILSQRKSIESNQDYISKIQFIYQSLQYMLSTSLNWNISFSLESNNNLNENLSEDSQIESFWGFLQDIIKHQNYYIEEPKIEHLEQILRIIFYDYEIIISECIKIISSLSTLYNVNFLATSRLGFYELFMLFMRDIERFSLSDTTGGKIRIIGALEARSLSFKEVLILDFTDDLIPNVKSDNMFLNSRIRKFYNIPTKQDKEKLFKHHYFNIIKNTQKAHISFVNNAQKVPSTMLFELRCDIDMAQDIDMIYQYYDMQDNLPYNFVEDNFGAFSYTKPFSPTAIDIYQTCQRKFFFKYIEGLSSEPTSPNGANHKDIGICIHNALYKAYSKFIGTHITSENIDLLANTFEQECLHQAQNTEYSTTTKLEIEKLCYLAKHFFDYEKSRVRKSTIEILALEYDFHAKCGKHEFVGIIDRIEKHDNAIWIYDYKTGKKPKDIESMQMPIYSLCIEMAKESFSFLTPYKNLPMNYVYVYASEFAQDNEKSFILEQKRENLKESQSKLLEILESFGKENTQTKQTAICNICEYNLLCQRV